MSISQTQTDGSATGKRLMRACNTGWSKIGLFVRVDNVSYDQAIVGIKRVRLCKKIIQKKGFMNVYDQYLALWISILWKYDRVICDAISVYKHGSVNKWGWNFNNNFKTKKVWCALTMTPEYIQEIGRKALWVTKFSIFMRLAITKGKSRKI